MFYRAAYDQEQTERKEMTKNEQHNWLIQSINKPDIGVEVDGNLSEDDQIKFRSVCVLRFLQMMQK